MDMDGVVERRGHFLGLEAKPLGASIDEGQWITLQALAAQPNWTVLIMYGARDNPARMLALGEISHPIGPCKLEDARNLVSQWFAMANGSRQEARA